MSSSTPYRDTGFEYIKGSKHVLFSNGVLLGLNEFKALDKDNEVVHTILKRHKDGKDTRYDYNAALNEGVLRKLPLQKPEERKNIIQNLFTSDAKRTKEQAQIPFISVKPRKVDTSGNNVARVSRVVELVMIVVALGSAIMSTYHTTVFMCQQGKPFWSSLMTGTIMICFSATAFTAARYFLQEKSATLIFGLIFIVLGCGVVFYSMFSTVTVNFNQYSWVDRQETEELIEASSEVLYADQMRFVMEGEVARLDEELKRLKEEAEYWKTRSWAKFDDLQIHIKTTEEKRSEAWQAFISHIGVRAQAEQVVAKSKGSVYAFVANLFNVNEDMLFFIIYTIPAVFYDIASPFGFTIILLLQERRRRGGK